MKKWVAAGILLILIGVAAVSFSKKNGLQSPQLPGEPVTTSPSTTESQTTESDGPLTLTRGTDVPLNIPQGYSIDIFASGIAGARDLQYSPGGTLLVTATRQGGVYALPDADKNGKTDETKRILTGLDRPHGMAFFQGKLYVAQETAVTRYDWNEKNLTASNGQKILTLPRGGNHYTRSMVIRDNGTILISLGSSCNVCREEHPWIATVIEKKLDDTDARVYSKGLRNAVFLAVHPTTGNVWATEMGRDQLGDDIPPDEINILQDGKDYGWPICYGDNIHDTQFDKNTYIQNPCNNTVAPAFKIQAHSAPLGLAFIQSSQFPASWRGDLLVSYHGSWNRSEPTGYKIVKLNVDGETVTQQEDFVTGFLSGGDVIGRPVDVTFDEDGNLYISDDKAGYIYRLRKS